MPSSLRYLSVCSGIEAASVAWHPLGWTPVAFSEIEPFPSSVLAHRFPDVPNLGDMTAHATWPLRSGDIDLLVGGTPCQSFSVAGLRRGLSDPRGGLMLTYLEIAQRLRPRWIVWENVPGVLSSGRGRDFGSFLGALGELGYGWAYRVLDAQWVRTQRHPRAVPQRRRRVFVVGCLGDWRAAAEVLFERESVRRDPAPRAASRQGSSDDAEGCVARCITTGEMKRQDYETCTMIAQDVAATLNQFDTGERDTHAVAHAFYSTGGTHGVNQHSEVSPAVKVGSGLGIPSPPAVAFKTGNSSKARSNAESIEVTPTLGSDAGGNTVPAVAHSLRADGFDASEDGTGRGTPLVPQAMTVRRLTPRECERLQGFPDDWTLIPWRKRDASDCPDGPRYKALGNSMAVNCMEWIGERIAAKETRR